jgi:hypothetical protein
MLNLDPAEGDGTSHVARPGPSCPAATITHCITRTGAFSFDADVLRAPWCASVRYDRRAGGDSRSSKRELPPRSQIGIAVSSTASKRERGLSTTRRNLASPARISVVAQTSTSAHRGCCDGRYGARYAVDARQNCVVVAAECRSGANDVAGRGSQRRWTAPQTPTWFAACAGQTIVAGYPWFHRTGDAIRSLRSVDSV